MGLKKYTIILDTNILGNYKKGSLQVSDFNYLQIDKDAFLSLIKFIQNNQLLKDVEIAFSKISIEEIKHHQNELFKNKKEKLVRLINELSSVGTSNTNLEDLDYEKHLSDKARAFAGVYGLKVLEYPPDSCLKKLIEKALKHKKPFYKKDSDSGFKDALIWESIIHYAKENPDREYIFLTTDPDFSQDLEEEFMSETESEIIIKSSVLDVKKILVEKATLKTHFDKMSQIYSEKFKIIEDGVNEKFRNIIVEGDMLDIERISLNKYLFDLEFNDKKYCLKVTGNIFYSGMVWGFNPYEGDIDWYLKQDVEPDLFHIILKREMVLIKLSQ